MNHLITRHERRRLACTSVAVTLVLLACAACPPGAVAGNVPNPDEALIARWEPCEPNTGVTVIVDYHNIGDRMIDVGCALGEQATGVEALQHAGFALEGTTDEGLAFICRIDGEPTPEEEGCETTPGGSAYWSYWRGKPGGRWAYSGVGAKSPQSRSPINSVEGWSFGGGSAPRIEPMDGSGPSAFRLPPEQESSVIPAELAREWLVPVLDETARQTEEQEADAEGEGKAIPDGPGAKELLPGAISLARAGVEPAALKAIADWLARSCKAGHAMVEGCPLRELADPSARREEQYAQRFALAVLGLQALGQSPDSFAGMDPRGALEGMIKQSSGQVSSEGELTAAIEVTAPTVLALARTGTLSEAALKTVDLILASQDANGSFEGEVTPVDVEAIEALVAAREQGAKVLGQSRLEQMELALGKAGGYLEGIQEAQGGLPYREGGKADVEASALGAVGLALAGRKTAGERAARWVSSYQVTAEYAGVGNRETGEHTPAEDVIGAFLAEEGALREALVYGVRSSSAHGLYAEAQLPTADALLALVTAGPYGPYDASFAEQSLLFETRTVGSPSKPLAATVTNHDVRSFMIAGVSIAGEHAEDFSVHGDQCTGKTLAPGETCEVSASFDPTASGPREAQLQVALAGTSQTIELTITGTGEAPRSSSLGKGGPEGSTGSSTTGTASQGVLGEQSASLARVQTPSVDGQGAGRGLVGVSWRILEPGVGLRSWTIAGEALGVAGAHYVTAAAGPGSATSALLKLPPGFAYELRITFTDVLGRSSSTQIGKVLVPYDDRWSGLHYRGYWQRMRQPDAWLGTVSRATSGAHAAASLPSGRPVFMLRATSAEAKVEVRAGGARQVFVVAGGPSGALRQITAGERTRAGMVSLWVLKGTVELDGVAVEG